MTLYLHILTLDIAWFFYLLWEYFRLKIPYPLLGNFRRFGAKRCWRQNRLIIWSLSSHNYYYLSHILAIHPLQQGRQKSLDWYLEQSHLGKYRSVRAGLDPPQRNTPSDKRIWRCPQMQLAFRPNQWPWGLWRLGEEEVWDRRPNHKVPVDGSLVPNFCPTDKSCCNLERVHRSFWISSQNHTHN